jgi:O-methyltransferase/methyltransferase family protein
MQVLRMTDGLALHQSLHVAASLGIADLLKDGERTAADLATALGVHADALYRMLRFLCGHGVFQESGGQFANSTLSECLRSDVPDSIRSIVVFRGRPYYFAAFGELLFSVETGQPAGEKVLGTGGFEYLRRHPEEGRIFDEAMSAISGLWATAIAGAYDFGRWGSLMDVGGGNGALLAAILGAHRGLRGVLADQAHVLERPRHRDLGSPEVASRLRVEACDFFEAIPSGCRALLMKNIIHDWDDARAGQILRNCRRAVPEDGAVLLVEYRLGDDNVRSLGKAVDLAMLAVTGGRERTVEEHRRLLASCRLRLDRTFPCGDVMILEARPV